MNLLLLDFSGFNWKYILLSSDINKQTKKTTTQTTLIHIVFFNPMHVYKCELQREGKRKEFNPLSPVSKMNSGHQYIWDYYLCGRVEKVYT